MEKEQAVRAVLSDVEVSTFTGLLTTVFHLPFLVQVKLLPGHLNLYLFHEIFKKILKRVSIIRGCDLICLLVHSELLPGNLTTHRKIVHLKISSECTYIQSSNFFFQTPWCRRAFMVVDVNVRRCASASLLKCAPLQRQMRTYTS